MKHVGGSGAARSAAPVKGWKASVKGGIFFYCKIIFNFVIFFNAVMLIEVLRKSSEWMTLIDSKFPSQLF